MAINVKKDIFRIWRVVKLILLSFQDTTYTDGDKSAEEWINVYCKMFWRFLSSCFFLTNLTGTEEGKAAEKRVRVYCGVCKETRYYSIHRGVTRIGSVVLACEACRHYYQKFKRQPCILRCRDKDSGRCSACFLLYHTCLFSLRILVFIVSRTCGIVIHILYWWCIFCFLCFPMRKCCLCNNRVYMYFTFPLS